MRSLKRILAVALVGLATWSCRDNPTSSSSTPQPLPRAGVTQSANGVGACMGEDALASGFTSGLGSATSLNCTANDIQIAYAQITGYKVGAAGTFTTLPVGQRITCVAGDTVFAITNAFLQNNAQTRYDIGVWIAVDGGN